jgi:hypothetical protein
MAKIRAPTTKDNAPAERAGNRRPSLTAAFDLDLR